MNESRRKTAGVTIIAVLLVLSTAITAWLYFGTTPPSPVGEAVIEDNNGDRLAIEPTNNTVWDLLQDLHEDGTWTWIGGPVSSYDNSWGYSFEPDSIIVAQDVPGDSQSTIRDISDALEYWADHGPVYINASVVLINGLPSFSGSTTNYSIQAVLHTNNHTLSGLATVDYINTAKVTLDELVFHVYPNAFQPEGGIIIESFRYQGHNLSYSIEGIDSTILRVDMIAGLGPGPIGPGDVVRVEIEFQVLIPEKVDRFGWFYDDTPAELLVYNFGNWYPIAAVYDDRGWHTAPYTFNSETFYSEVAMYNVSLTVPTEFILAATGELQTTSQEIDERTWVWSAGPSHDFAWVASPDFLTESMVVDGLNITSYFTTEHSGTGSQALSIAADALQVYENLFGPYPWESFRIVETISSVSMEYPQLVMITTPSYETPSVLERFIAHEVAHQWVPFAIGVDSFSEPWIDEGFATYGEFCYYEYVYDNATRQSHRESLLASYFAHVFDWGDDSLNHSMDYWVVASGYGAIVYEKAALVFDMLRYQIGNDAFYNAWQQIYLEFLHKNLRAGDLIQIFENTVGASLDWFFDHWINEEGIVTLNFVEASAYLDGTEWTLDFELNQTGDVQLSIWVPVRVNYTVGSELLWVWLPTLSNSLHTVSVDFTPVTLELDPDSLLLCRYGVSIVDVTI